MEVVGGAEGVLLTTSFVPEQCAVMEQRQRSSQQQPAAASSCQQR